MRDMIKSALPVGIEMRGALRENRKVFQAMLKKLNTEATFEGLFQCRIDYDASCSLPGASFAHLPQRRPFRRAPVAGECVIEEVTAAPR
jgi:hypothetical protein